MEPLDEPDARIALCVNSLYLSPPNPLLKLPSERETWREIGVVLPSDMEEGEMQTVVHSQRVGRSPVAPEIGVKFACAICGYAVLNNGIDFI